MPRDYDEARGDEWFSTIYVDSHLNSETIHLAGSDEKGLKIYIEADTLLDDRKVHELVRALQRYERWRKERAVNA